MNGQWVVPGSGYTYSDYDNSYYYGGHPYYDYYRYPYRGYYGYYGGYPYRYWNGYRGNDFDRGRFEANRGAGVRVEGNTAVRGGGGLSMGNRGGGGRRR
jgi:hypothetical protein